MFAGAFFVSLVTCLSGRQLVSEVIGVAFYAVYVILPINFCIIF